MRYSKYSLFIPLLFVLVLTACTGDSDKPTAPEVDHIAIDYDLIRYDRKLSEIAESSDPKAFLNGLKTEYPAFSDIYFRYILPIRGKDDIEIASNLKKIFEEPSIQKLQDTINIVYPDTKKIETELASLFQYFKHYFPEYTEPQVYTFLSEYSHQAFVFDDNGRDGLGLGLDMFLGDDFPYEAMAVDNPAFSGYLSRTFNKDHITRKAANVMVTDRLGNPSGNRLLDHMIHNGKKLYILRRLLPNHADHIVHEYTPEQMKWIKENELEMWAFFFDKDLFYESDMFKINKYINDSPSSPGMPEEAPGRTGNYMGLQIVEAYMKKHPSTSLDQLIQLQDAQIIMDKSKYKPRRK